MQYCTGRTNRLLQCCLVKQTDEGYQLALTLLEERFGNSFAIAQEWVKNITSRSDVKGIEDLREFADDLTCCKETLHTMDYSTELDNSHHMLSIVEKLPYYLQMKWVRENHSIKLKQKRNSKLPDWVEFVKLAADEASDPVFGKVGFKERKGEREKSPKGKIEKRGLGTFAAKIVAMDGDSKPEHQKSSEKCPCCQQPHYLTQCKKFKALRIKGRWSLVRFEGLCVGSFKPGHLGRDCPRPFTCTVYGCGMKHNKFLHLPTRREHGAFFCVCYRKGILHSIRESICIHLCIYARRESHHWVKS